MSAQDTELELWGIRDPDDGTFAHHLWRRQSPPKHTLMLWSCDVSGLPDMLFASPDEAETARLRAIEEVDEASSDMDSGPWRLSDSLRRALVVPVSTEQICAWLANEE